MFVGCSAVALCGNIAWLKKGFISWQLENSRKNSQYKADWEQMDERKTPDKIYIFWICIPLFQISDFNAY